MPLTLAQMIALLPDNTAGNISEQDLRDVVTALHTAGAAVFAGSVAAVAINSVTDVSIFSEDVTDIVAGDLLQVEVWGFSRNATGGNRTVTLTLDFDAAFDLEWEFTSVSQVQPFRITAEVAVASTSLATVILRGAQSPQITVGAMTYNTGTYNTGYDTTTQNLTGTTAVTLHARSSDTTATQELTVLGLVIRKLTAT